MATRDNGMSYSATFDVGCYVCTMTFVRSTRRLACEWAPRVPPPKSLSKQELDQYRAGRDVLMAEIARGYGNILI
jgi:hypothetical protein